MGTQNILNVCVSHQWLNNNLNKDFLNFIPVADAIGKGLLINIILNSLEYSGIDCEYLFG